MKLDQTNEQILQHICAGLTLKEIADKVNLHRSVVNYRLRFMRLNIGAKNTIELALWYETKYKEKTI